jgi:hypothetical protein
LRQFTTLACVLIALAALTALGFGHLIHGTLLMLGALSLVPGSVWGSRHRRYRRRLVGGKGVDLSPSQLQAQQLRKAA